MSFTFNFSSAFEHMIFFLLLAVFVLIAMMVVAIIIIVLLALIVFICISSISFLNGMYHHSVSKGVKLSVQLLMTLIGGSAGWAIAFISYHYSEYSITSWVFYTAGFLSGMLGGWGAAVWCLMACRLLLKAAVKKSEDMYSEDF